MKSKRPLAFHHTGFTWIKSKVSKSAHLHIRITRIPKVIQELFPITLRASLR